MLETLTVTPPTARLTMRRPVAREMPRPLIERAHHAVLVGNIGDVTACHDAHRGTARAALGQVFAVCVQQGKIGALAGEVYGERAADAAPGSGHENGFAANIHGRITPAVLRYE